MLVDQKPGQDRQRALPNLSRRTFLRLAAQLSLLSAVLPRQRTLAASAVQALPQASGYGNGVYGQGVYAGSISFAGSTSSSPEMLNHTIYLPIVTKEEN
jgi:hypothetical protein